MIKVFRPIAATTLAAATVLAAVAPAQALLLPVPGPCAYVTVIGARDSGQPQGDTKGQLSGFGAEASGAAQEAMRQLGKSKTVHYVPLRYPATGNNIYLPGRVPSPAYSQSVKAGIAALKVQVDYFVRACPSTKIVLIGFGQGAQVIHEAAAGMSAPTAKRISVVALIADPRRNVKDPIAWNPMAGRGVSYNGALGAGPLLPKGFAGRAASFCHASDPVCNFPGGLRPMMFPDPGMKAHTTYYQTPAARASMGSWVAGRLVPGCFPSPRVA
jgi:cutinase